MGFCSRNSGSRPAVFAIAAAFSKTSMKVLPMTFASFLDQRHSEASGETIRMRQHSADLPHISCSASQRPRQPLLSAATHYRPLLHGNAFQWPASSAPQQLWNLRHRLPTDHDGFLSNLPYTSSHLFQNVIHSPLRRAFADIFDKVANHLNPIFAVVTRWNWSPYTSLDSHATAAKGNFQNWQLR